LPVTRYHHALMGLARSSEFRIDEASDRIGSSLPLWSWPCSRPLRISLRRSARMNESSGRSSLDLSLPSRARLHRGRRWRGYPLHGCLPCGSLPLRRFPGSGQLLISRGTNPRVRALSAFRTLSGLSSTRSLPALLRAGPALGVSPFRVEFTRRAVRPLGRRCPPGVGLPTSYRPGIRGLVGLLGIPVLVSAARKETAPPPAGPSSGLCSLRVSVSPAGVLCRFEDRDPRGLRPP
jgi:hypothetical protein